MDLLPSQVDATYISPGSVQVTILPSPTPTPTRSDIHPRHAISHSQQGP